MQRVVQYRVHEDESTDGDEPVCQKVSIKDDEFGGLIGNLASSFMKEGGLNIGGRGSGGGAGGGGSGAGVGNFLGDLAGQFLKGGKSSGGSGNSGGDYRGSGGGGTDVGSLIGGLIGGGTGKKSGVGGLIGDILGGGKKSSGSREYGGGGSHSGGGGQPDIGNLIGGLIQGGGGKGIGSLIGGLVSGGGKGGGANVPKDSLNGGIIETISSLIGYGAHKFFGIDPVTGRIIAAIAGNLILNLGGKDNVLGNIGEIVLDNIVSGKYKRKVDPFIPSTPSEPTPGPPPPPQPGQVQDFATIRRECLQSRQLFEDPVFPADDSSLFYSQRPSKRIEWLRPGVCLDYGAKVDSIQENKSTPFHFACAQGSLPIVKLLYEAYLKQVPVRQREEEHRNLLNAKDCMDMTPLHRATIYDHVNVVEYLIEQGASLDEVDSHQRTPLLVAVAGNGNRSATILLEAGAKLEIEDINKRNVLHYLVLNAIGSCGLISLIERIVQDPKDQHLLNSKNNIGCTPLHMASRAGSVEFTETLLKLGALVRLKDKDDQSPLHFAARYGRYRTVKRLLESAAGPNIINETDRSRATALHIASANGHAKTVQLLMCKGALIHKDHMQKKPLHLAAENGYSVAIRVLVAFHNNLLNSKCKTGDSPLHLAAASNQPACVEFLLSADCKYVINDSFKTPLEVAVEKQNVEAATAMLQHKRWEEILAIYHPSSTSSVFLLIERMPQVYKIALDRSVTRSSSSNNEKPNSPDWAMVRFGRIELLSHPVSLAYLHSKWLSYGFFFFFLTMFFYVTFVLCLTSTIFLWYDPVIHDSYNRTASDYFLQYHEVRVIRGE